VRGITGESLVETVVGHRIGDALVQKGLVSPEQLGAALEKQSDLGGPLGASLLELGFVDERDLGQALSEQRGVRYAPLGMVRSIKTSARKALTRPLLWKHRAVPFKLEGDTLHLMVADLRNLSGLSTKTGYRIVPWLAPEVRVHRELQRHFKIPMSPRYSEIADRLESGESPPEPSSARWLGQDADAAIDRPAEALPDSDSFRASLIQAEDGDDAVRIVLDRTAGQMATCILFRIKDGVARVWDLRGHMMNPDVRASFAVPAMSGSLLELLAVHPAYRGPVPDERPYRRFFVELDLPMPREIVLVPVKVAGRLVGILYGDSGVSGEIEAPFDEQNRLGQKLGLALTLMLIRRKILE
jgi:hypothetical protein